MGHSSAISHAYNEVFWAMVDFAQLVSENYIFLFCLFLFFLSYRVLSSSSARSTQLQRPLAGNAGRRNQHYVALADIRYCQDSIAEYFNDGRSLQETIDALRRDPSTIEKIPMIQIVRYEGKLWTVNNRRLYVMKEAFSGRTLIPVQEIPASDYFRQNQRTSFTDGLTIRVRRSGHNATSAPRRRPAANLRAELIPSHFYLRLDDIRYSTDSCSSVFRDGHSLDETIDDLCDGTIEINDIPMIEVVRYDGVWWANDNRRLVCFNEAFRGTTRIPVKEIPVTDFFLTSRLTTKTDGKTIIVRGW